MGKGAGDPDGRRIARRNAILADEASKLADALCLRLRLASLPFADDVANVAKNLRVLSSDEMTKAEGHVEPRLTTKNTGSPLLENRKVSLLFLDESGTASFNSNDKVFALGGVSMFEEHVDAYIAQADDIKRRHFGRTDITFHEPDMRKHENAFSFYDPALCVYNR